MKKQIGPTAKSVADDNSKITRNHFPSDFIFGTATSAFQVEGAHAKNGKGLSVWDTFTMETPGRIADGSNGNIAADMYHRYKEDVKTMRSMGFDAYRFSISWPRILPGGRCSAGINREGIDYYNDLINTLLAHGIEPYVTLFHWDLPDCLEKEYDGFLNKRIVDDFREYAELCFWEFGDRVKYWMTLNEPWTYCVSGYVLCTFPPSKVSPPTPKFTNNLLTCNLSASPHTQGSVPTTTNLPPYRGSPIIQTCPNTDPSCPHPKQTVPLALGFSGSDSKTDPAKDSYTVGRNLLLAHAATVHSYRTKFQEHQEGKIGMSLCSHWFTPLDENSKDDKEAATRAIDFMLGWFLEPVLYGTYPQSMTDFVPEENLAQFSHQESHMLKGSIDFLGLNYYTANYVTKDPNHDESQRGYYKDQQVAFHTKNKDGDDIGKQAGSSWLYIVPWGIYEHLKYLKNTYKDLPPIYITENGMDEKSNCALTARDVCQDTTRVKYYQDHLANVLKAMKEGVDVKAYFAWSWCDNFEWVEGYKVRFGITYIDYVNNQTRYPKNSAIWFSKFLTRKKHLNKRQTLNNGVIEPMKRLKAMEN